MQLSGLAFSRSTVRSKGGTNVVDLADHEHVALAHNFLFHPYRCWLWQLRKALMSGSSGRFEHKVHANV
jgi:hypothetical protein